MNARRLLVTLAVLLMVGIAFNSRSTLTPKRGAHHVFYGAGENHFIGQYSVVGNFNGDAYDDVVTSARWDDPSVGGVSLKSWPKSFQCSDGPPSQKDPWGTIIAEKGGVKRRVCDFPGAFGDEHWAYWQSLGWSAIPGESGDCNYCYSGGGLQCDSCYTYEIRSEDQGALTVIDGANSWASKGHDIDLTTAAPSHLITGKSPGDGLYWGLAVGRTNSDQYDDLLAGAIGANAGAGEAYVINGAASWSTTISLASTTLLQHTLKGRDAGDEFGKGVAVGDLDGDNLDDIVVSAPGSGGLGNAKTASGEVYVFYSSATIPATVNLSGLTDNQVDALGYVSVIYGPADSAQVGVTHIDNWHGAHQGLDNHRGRYYPVGLAIGDWDDDGFNDLAIGAGWAEKSAAQVFAGAVYVIFGTDPNGAGPHKLSPGNRVDLANSPSSSGNAPDIKFVGKTGGRLGAGVAFLDANDEGVDGRDDLLIGAPLTTTGGKTECGEAYIVFGDSKASLLATRSRNVGTAGHVNVTIIGEDTKDRLGSQFEGNRDIDQDSNNDIGMIGEREKYAFFLPSGGSWASSINLYNIEETSPSTRMIEMQGSPVGHSVTIRFAKIDGDNYRDLVFGGYDNPGYSSSPGFPYDGSGSVHAGQMWVTRGQDMWKSGTISANTSWSGVVFVRGDVIVESGATLTIAAGTDVWMWPTQVGTNLGADATLCELLVENGGLVVNGTSDAPVRFLAWETNGPESSANDKWFGIWVDDGCSATINYATIRNALRGIQARSPITVKNSTIEDCKIVGMTVAGDSTNADSVYVENTTIRRIGRTSGGIGVNVLGKKAVVKLKSCDVDSCEIGIACYTKGKLYTDDTDVRNATTHGLRVNNRAAATLYNSRFESHAMSAVRVYNASEVSATACTFGTSDYGAEITSEGGSPSFGTFTSCTFTENDVGLRVVSGSEAIVSASTFSNDDDGIYDIGATVQVAGTTLDSDFNAAVLDGEATADFTSSTVGTNDGGTGIRVTDASYVGLVNSRIWHNLLGVWVDEASATSLDNCSSTCPSTCANGNSFMYNGTRHIKNQNSSGTIDAECNYWGAAPPDASKFYGSVDYTPYLSADPTDELMVFALPSKLPKEYRLAQNYPNPFNPVTTIAYDVPSPGGKVEIRVYSVNGQLVRSVVSGFRPPGEHRATWPGVSNANVPVASGVYFLRMDAPNFRATRKLILLK